MKKVTIYTTPTCVYCQMAKAFLSENNVEYEEKDVSVDTTAREKMVEESHQLGVPVIIIDGEVFVGFDKKVISEALGI